MLRLFQPAGMPALIGDRPIPHERGMPEFPSLDSRSPGCLLASLLSWDDPDPIEALKNRMHLTLLARSEEDLETGCWVFVGAWDRSGEGVLRVGHLGTFTAGRVAAWVYRGVELSDPAVRVRHACRMPACFRPEHLRIERRATWNDGDQQRRRAA